MIKSKALILFLVLPLMLVLFSCSQGSEKDTIFVCAEQTDYWISNSPPIVADLNGSYYLSGFDMDYYTAFDNYIKTITEADLDTATGTMIISPAWVDQDYSLAGTVDLARRWYLIFGDESYTYTKGSVNWADANSGAVAMDGIPVPFTTSGDSLSLTYPTWCFLLEVTPDPAIGGTP